MNLYERYLSGETLEQNNIDVERINSKKVLAKKIYEDEYQIRVLPYRDFAKKVK